MNPSADDLQEIVQAFQRPGPLNDELLDRLRGDGIHTVLAGIALPNPASVRLHESVGFAHLGTMREVGRKLGCWIDVAWYQRLL